MSEAAGATITATFKTRRQADLALEHLVQDLGIDRTDVFLAAEGDSNSVGREPAGADVESGHPNTDPASDPALAGGITLSVDLADEARVQDVRAALEEVGGEDLAVE